MLECRCLEYLIKNLRVCAYMSDLISIVEHTRSQEGPQDVAYRSTRTPQAKHKAAAGRQGKVYLLQVES